MPWYTDLLGVLGNSFRIGKASLSASDVSSAQTFSFPAAGGTLATTDMVGGVSVGTSPPVNPTSGSLWFDAERGELSMYYQDIDSAQWVSPLSGTAVVIGNIDGGFPNSDYGGIEAIDAGGVI